MLNWQSKQAGDSAIAALNFSIAASGLLARLAVTPSSKIFFNSAALAVSLAAVVGASTIVMSAVLPIETFVMLLASPIFGSLAVTLYAPDSVSNWMNSPRLSVLVESLRPEPFWNSIVMVTP